MPPATSPQVPQNGSKQNSKKVWLIIGLIAGAILLWILPLITLRYIFPSGEKPSAHAEEVISNIEVALNRYGQDNNHYPESVQELVARGYLSELPKPEVSDNSDRPYWIEYSPTSETHGGPTLVEDAQRVGVDVYSLGTCPISGGGDTLYADGPQQQLAYDTANPKEPTTAFCATTDTSTGTRTMRLACGYELSYLRGTGSPYGEPDAPDAVISKTVKSRYSQGVCVN